jgi:hypothetical protein
MLKNEKASLSRLIAIVILLKNAECILLLVKKKRQKASK